jgi:hypothetical protein
VDRHPRRRQFESIIHRRLAARKEFVIPPSGGAPVDVVLILDSPV